MIQRDLTEVLLAAARKFPAVTLTGPRQSGKSTLCRKCFPRHPYVSLESPDIRDFAEEDTRGFLAQFPKGAIIDEVQRCPRLPSYLQGMIDREPRAGRWILTGSQNLLLLRSVSQSLAGRAAVLHLLPLTRNEVRRFKRHPLDLDHAMLTGGYPAILHRRIKPAQWLASYVRTYVERDVRSITQVVDLVAFQRFLELCAGRTGQLLNLSGLAGECGISQPTAAAWISILETSFITFRLPPLEANVSKRLVKMPKLHFYDSGLACWLLGIRSASQLRSHPLRGAIFETWLVSEIVKHRLNHGEDRGVYFYRDQHALEADIIVQCRDKVRVIEVKSGQTPSSDMLRKVGRVAEILKPVGKPTPMVVYGGDVAQSRGDARIIPWNQVDGESWV